MNEKDGSNAANEETPFSREVGAQAARKLKAQRGGTRSVWFGLGMSGLIGWSVTVPALVGAAIGIWVDKRYPSPYSWTLMLLLIGLIIGCLNAWRWVDSEYKEIQGDMDE
ncbi:MAG: AtpZ/AtpI family protein [Isosphaeraceae bacterium]|nr:AtpZ/AtpI family protein [Isosphaeraceae bacterium]